VSNVETLNSTFTRRPVQKTENEIKIEERALAKKVFIIYFFYSLIILFIIFIYLFIFFDHFYE
jgi:hypothetical protein